MLYLCINFLRYDLLQQLSAHNARYAQKFLLALSLDPTAEAKMLRERVEAAKVQVLYYSVIVRI